MLTKGCEQGNLHFAPTLSTMLVTNS